MTSNITLMKWMIANGYLDKRTLERRIKAMEAWLAKPDLLAPDADAEYAAVIEIDLADIHEPIVACPNDPDDVKTLAEVAGDKIDDVFVGSCMTNIGHFRAASKLLEGKTDIPVKPVDRAADQDGPAGADRRRPLRHAGPHRRAHGNAGLLAVHG
jgi:aconitate hydratase 2/2-methylisocitrate dehydratase